MFLYVLVFSEPFIKVGISSDIPARINGLISVRFERKAVLT
jgi:hypothetical protein